MKLSEMSTRKAAECMVELAAPVGALVKDPAVREYLEKAAQKKASIDMLADAVGVLLPVFLQKHYSETVKVLSILTGKSAPEIDEQPIKTTISDVKESLDGDLFGFFFK